VSAGAWLEYRYTWRATEIRVLVAGDVLALPLHGWSMGGFGASISIEWLEHDGRLPGSSADERRALASCLVRSLDEARAVEPGAVAGSVASEIRGPLVRCSSCDGGGWVPK
jgi:hypothetical protein